MIVDVAEAAVRLRRGEVVAYPTETVYGLAADVRSPAALEALFALKERAADRAVSLLIEDTAALAAHVSGLPARARALAARFWPGPLTLVVPVPADSAFAHVASDRGVGFRCSPQRTAAALAVACAFPIASTSCNRSGDAPCESAEEVWSTFGDALPIAGGEDAGRAEPSTVVAIDPENGLELLREGALSLAELEDSNRGAA